MSSIGAFLADRRLRATLHPAANELAQRPRRRRLPPGLRSVEVALRAGIDPGYYAKLEQGRATAPSPEILDAVARALELTEAETAHLFDLASEIRRARGTGAREPIPAGVLEALDQVPEAPAYVI
ncbi:MAG: helix-turn-helix domain-containing protein [Chloroflexi bacterium]|nr:helix-turn-helix domain-containing protein [Chloroflexota bacterium]